MAKIPQVPVTRYMNIAHKKNATRFVDKICHANYLFVHGIEEARRSVLALRYLASVVPSVENFRAQTEPVLHRGLQRTEGGMDGWREWAGVGGGEYSISCMAIVV